MQCLFQCFFFYFSGHKSRGGSISLFPRRTSTNSPVRSATRSGPASDRSTPGSIPSVTCPVLLASDWPGNPLRGGARESHSGRPVGRPIWGSPRLGPQQQRRQHHQRYQPRHHRRWSGGSGCLRPRDDWSARTPPRTPPPGPRRGSSASSRPQLGSRWQGRLVNRHSRVAWSYLQCSSFV